MGTTADEKIAIVTGGNSGIGGKGAFVDTKTADFDRIMKTNLYSAYWRSREAFRVMLKQAPDKEADLHGGIIPRRGAD